MEVQDVKTVFIAYGSNQGNWSDIYTRVLTLLNTRVGKILAQSKTYVTPAWGKTDQPDFKNGVLKIQTKLKPILCLKELQQIEKDLGRVKTEKWGPRIIDLDIIDYDNQTYFNKDLCIPHPYAKKRQFVLEPLNDLAPNLILPGQNLTVKQLLLAMKPRPELQTLN